MLIKCGGYRLFKKRESLVVAGPIRGLALGVDRVKSAGIMQIHRPLLFFYSALIHSFKWTEFCSNTKFDSRQPKQYKIQKKKLNEIKDR